MTFLCILAYSASLNTGINKIGMIGYAILVTLDLGMMCIGAYETSEWILQIIFCNKKKKLPEVK
jgi:hypothetical protein